MNKPANPAVFTAARQAERDVAEQLANRRDAAWRAWCERVYAEEDEEGPDEEDLVPLSKLRAMGVLPVKGFE